jgi:hypothetical protein
MISPAENGRRPKQAEQLKIPSIRTLQAVPPLEPWWEQDWVRPSAPPRATSVPARPLVPPVVWSAARRWHQVRPILPAGKSSGDTTMPTSNACMRRAIKSRDKHRSHGRPIASRRHRRHRVTPQDRPWRLLLAHILRHHRHNFNKLENPWPGRQRYKVGREISDVALQQLWYSYEVSPRQPPFIMAMPLKCVAQEGHRLVLFKHLLPNLQLILFLFILY